MCTVERLWRHLVQEVRRCKGVAGWLNSGISCCQCSQLSLFMTGVATAVKVPGAQGYTVAQPTSLYRAIHTLKKCHSQLSDWWHVPTICLTLVDT